MELKKYSSELSESLTAIAGNKLLADIFYNADNAMAYINAHGQILHFNKSFDQLNLSSNSKFKQVPITNFLGESSIIVFNQMVRWILKNDTELTKRIIFVNDANEKIVTKMSLSPVSLGLNELILVIIEPENPQEKLHNLEKKYSQIFLSISENLNEGIFRSSPEDGMIYINKSFAQLFGYNDINETLKITPSVHYANKDERDRTMKLLNEEGRIVNQSILFRKKNGDTFWGMMNCSITKEYNGKIFYDGAVVNIDELKRAEEALQQKNRELKKINAQMDRFFYSAYHDIRSPIASVLGLTNIMRLEMKDDYAHSYLDKIEESLRKLDFFVNDVKNFSQNARQHIVSKRIDFKEIIKTIWRKFKYSHNYIDLEFKADDDKFFFSDSTRISLILENIIKNSVQYYDKSKNEHYIKVNVILTAERAIIEVVDNGIGISRNHLGKVCDMFYRGTEISKGSGLGLYICHETLLKLKGQISIESELGLGTIVNIEIPNDSKGRLMSRKFILQGR